MDIKKPSLSSHEYAVQETSSEAFSTKAFVLFYANINRYAASLGYFEDPFIKFMAKSKPKKMLPIMNRGTWSRVHAYRKILSKFLTLPGNKQIISLGAGLDTTYFCLRNSHPSLSFKYIELDFPEIVAKKIGFISKNPILAKMKEEGTDSYFLIPCDIREVAKVTDEFSKTGLDSKTPTMILTECVLVYMEPEYSQPLLKSCAEYFENAAALNYEMINPHDSFGKMMVENIEERGCKLLGLKTFDSTERQKERFLEAGFAKAEAITMLEFYNKYAEKDEKLRIEKIEIFDEFEEWNILQSHYCLALANKGTISLSFD